MLIRTYRPSPHRQEIQRNAEKTVEDFMELLPQFLESINKLLDELESVQILGDKGILVEYFENGEAMLWVHPVRLIL